MPYIREACLLGCTDMCDIRQIRYLTNTNEMQFTLSCKNCGAPIDMEINGKGNAYVTIAKMR